MTRARTEGKGSENPNTSQTFEHKIAPRGQIRGASAGGAKGAKCGGCAVWHEHRAKTGAHGTGRDYTRRRAGHTTRGPRPARPRALCNLKGRAPLGVCPSTERRGAARDGRDRMRDGAQCPAAVPTRVSDRARPHSLPEFGRGVQFCARMFGSYSDFRYLCPRFVPAS